MKMLLPLLLAGLVGPGSPAVVKMGILLSGAGWETGNKTFPAALLALDEIANQWTDPIEVEYMIEDSNCAVEDAYKAAHNLLTWGAEVIIGPACSVACTPVSLMALQYNVPVISYACSATELSDKSKFPNFARTAESLAGVSRLLLDTFVTLNFTYYSILSTTESINVDSAIDVVQDQQSEYNDTDIQLGQLSTVVSGLADRSDGVTSGTEDQIENFLDSTWVIFIPMYDSDTNWVLNRAAAIVAKDLGVDVDGIWANSANNFAWFATQSLVGEDFSNGVWKNVFSLENDDPMKSHHASYMAFLARVQNETTMNLYDENNPQSLYLYLAYMYNAIIAWATAYQRAGTNEADKLIPEMQDGLTYNGAYRSETLDELAEPSNAIWLVRQYQENSGEYAWVDVIERDPADMNTLIVNDTIQWPGGTIIDPCKGAVCDTSQDNTALYVVVAVCAVLVVVVIAGAGYIVWKQQQKNKDDLKIEWKIWHSELDFTVKKSLAGSKKLVGAMDPEVGISSGISLAKYNHNYVIVKALPSPSIAITKEVLEELYLLKKVTHSNLIAFYGMCDEPGRCSVVVEYCAKGSLLDIAHNEDVHLDWMFKLSLIIDVAKGLRYLHTTAFGYHGNLMTSKCVVDKHWVCKLTDFGMKNIKKCPQTGSQSPNTRDLFYAAPERLWPCSKERTAKEYQKLDVYSLAIVMYELFSRRLPYDTGESSPERIVNRVKNRESPPCRPDLSLIDATDYTSHELVGKEEGSSETVPREAIELVSNCWKEMPFERNNMAETVQALEDMNPDRMLSITDRVVKMMEKYSEDLENKVAKKTQLLENQGSRNLSRFLPKKLIERIENGLETDKQSTERSVTGASIKIRLLDDRDQIAAINAYETFNNTEIEARNVYQVMDSDGHPLIVSGLNSETKHADHVLDYVRNVQRYAADNRISLRVAIHTGTPSCGLVLADTANPRMVLTGPYPSQIHDLLQSTAYGQVTVSATTKGELSDEIKLVQSVNVKVQGREEPLETWVLNPPGSPDKLHATQSAPPDQRLPGAEQPVIATPNGASLPEDQPAV